MKKNASSSSLDMTTVLQARPYGRFIKIKCHLRKNKLKAPIFLKAVFPFRRERQSQHLKRLFFLKGCVRYIFASLFFRSKREYLSNSGKCFLFHFKSSFRSPENQVLEFYIFKFHDVMKCLSIKQEIHFTE